MIDRSFRRRGFSGAALLLFLLIHSSSGGELTILFWGDRFARNFPERDAAGDTTLIGGAAQLASLVSMFRNSSSDALVLVAGGDLAGTVAAMKTKGVAPAKILGKLRPDVYGPGVVDFTHGAEALKKALGKGKVGAILANAHAESAGKLLPFDTLVKTENFRVAVTALIPPRLPELVPREGVVGLAVTDPFGMARQFANARREKADLLVVLSQLGREADSLLALFIPELDLIIEGHSREPFQAPLQVGRTLIVASGPYGRQLGRIRLEVSTEVHDVSLIDHLLIPIKSGTVEPDKRIAWSVVELEQRFNRTKGDRVATLLTDFNINRSGPANLPQWTADAMREAAGMRALALVNHLDFERGVEAGDLEEYPLFETSPFDVPLVVFQIKGYEIRQIIERQLRREIPFLTWSGVRVTAQNGRIGEINVERDGRLEDESEFAVVTNGLLWDRFKAETGIRPEIRPIFILPITQRELMLERARKQKVISVPLDDRWPFRHSGR